MATVCKCLGLALMVVLRFDEIISKLGEATGTLEAGKCDNKEDYIDGRVCNVVS